MITEATPEQWAEVEKIRQKWIDCQTRQIPFEEADAAVELMWKSMGKPKPQVFQVKGPIEMAKKYKEISDGKTPISKLVYTSVWWGVYAGYYEAGKVLGVKYDEEKYDTFIKWCNACPIVVPGETQVIVSQNPIQIHWRDQVLHNEDGPSVLYADGFKLWTIDGISVDEQIVMRPETQTIAQINKEDNADVKAIRIQRFGWPRYIAESNSKLLDYRDNDIEGTKEALYSTDNGHRMVVTCPTGRVFALGVPSDIKTCEAAAKWFRHPNPLVKKARIIART